MLHDEQYCTFYILVEPDCLINVFVLACVLMFSLIYFGNKCFHRNALVW